MQRLAAEARGIAFFQIIQNYSGPQAAFYPAATVDSPPFG